MKALVVYFSAEFGATAKTAKALAEAIGADLLAIEPEQPYTAADLKYMNPLARCNREFFAKKAVPVKTRTIDNYAEYDTVLIGFPIWYGCAPLVVNTFCQGLDFTGKKVAAFATSGGSAIGKTAAKLQPYISGATLLDARMMNGASTEAMKTWAEAL